MNLRTAVLVCIIFVMPESAWVQQTPVERAPSVDSAGSEEELKMVELKLADLMIHANWDEYEKQLAAGYTLIDAKGKLQSKDEIMAEFRKGERKIIVMEPEDLRGRIYGEASVLQGKCTTSVRESGHLRTRNERFTQVFIRRDGKWLLAAEQQTAIGK